MCEHGFVYPFTAGLRALYTLAVEPPEEIGLHLPPIVFVQRSYPRIEYVVFDIGHAARSMQAVEVDVEEGVRVNICPSYYVEVQLEYLLVTAPQTP